MAGDHRIIVRMERLAHFGAWILGVLSLTAALALVAGVAMAAPPLLPDAAFAVPADCRLEPFAPPSAEQRERAWRHCRAERLAVRLATPRVRPLDSGPSRVEVDVDHQVSRGIGPLTASARLGWSAWSAENFGGLRTARGLLAAGSRWRLDEGWALDLAVGHDTAPGLTRASLAAVYRPPGGLMFVQLAGGGAAGLAPAIGLRWRLAPRVGLDLGLMRAGAELVPRVGLRLPVFGR